MSPTPKSPKGPTSRRELEDLWRDRLEQAKKQLEIAIRSTREALTEFNSRSLPPPDGGLAVVASLRAEDAARNEYVRVLRVFTDLVVLGKTPE